MKSLEVLYYFLISLFSIVPFLFAEYFIGDFLLVPVIEVSVVFLVFLFLFKTSDLSFDSSFMLFSFWYLVFKIVIMSIYFGVENSYIAYNFLLGFFWINISVRGIENKDRMYWLLWFIVGVCLNIILTILYNVK